MTRHAKTRLSKDKRSLEIFVRIESSQCNVKRNVGWQWEGNEIIAGQYSVMGWDVVKSKCQVDFPETMIPKQKSKKEEGENRKNLFLNVSIFIVHHYGWSSNAISSKSKYVYAHITPFVCFFVLLPYKWFSVLKFDKCFSSSAQFFGMATATICLRAVSLWEKRHST